MEMQFISDSCCWKFENDIYNIGHIYIWAEAEISVFYPDKKK